MPMLFSFCYMVFTAIYFAATQIKVYPILDWSKPEKAVLWVVLYTVLCVPIMHLLLFGVYRLKLYLKERFSETDDKANGVLPPRESDANQNDILGETSTAQLLPVPHEATQNNHIEDVQFYVYFHFSYLSIFTFKVDFIQMIYVYIYYVMELFLRIGEKFCSIKIIILWNLCDFSNKVCFLTTECMLVNVQFRNFSLVWKRHRCCDKLLQTLLLFGAYMSSKQERNRKLYFATLSRPCTTSKG